MESTNESKRRVAGYLKHLFSNKSDIRREAELFNQAIEDLGEYYRFIAANKNYPNVKATLKYLTTKLVSMKADET